jgi:hypothetical protein
MAAPADSTSDAVLHEELRAAFNTHFYPDRVSEPVHMGAHSAARMHEEGHGGACLTELVAQLREHWHLFSPAEKAEMTEKLAPFKRDLLDPMPMRRSAVDGSPPPSSCFGIPYDNYIENEHFLVSWEDGALTDSEAEDFLDSLEESWVREIDELGWRAPTGTDTYPMMVTVVNGGYAGAYTTIDSCPGEGYIPYVVAYEGSFDSSWWWKVMACHEFNHASQYAYGQDHEFWWWEASATYMEEQVYPSYNDWANMVWSYSQTPYLGLNASQGSSSDNNLFWHTYAMAIWAFYLDQHVGGDDMVRETWEYAFSRTYSAYDLYMPEVIDGLDYSFEEVYTGFIANNAVMDYEERNYFETPRLTENIDVLPWDGGPDDNTRPQSLGQNYIKIPASLGEPGQILEVDFNGEDGPGWFALLVRGERSVDELVQIELDDNGQGTGTIEMNGEDPIYLIVSPWDPDAYGYRYNWARDEGYDYDYAARIQGEEVAEDTASTDEEEEEVSGKTGEGKKGCATAPGPTGLWMLGLLALRRRRQA